MTQLKPGFSKWDVTENLKTDEDIILFLEACFDEAGDDAAFIAAALGEVAHSKVFFIKGDFKWYEEKLTTT